VEATGQTGPAAPTESRFPLGLDDVAASPRSEPATTATGAGPTETVSAVPAPAASTGDVLKEALRPALSFLANVTVVTALLVYFGWRRAETQADRLGIDESILGMSTREYVLRSVGPVLTLLVGIGVGGLIWLSIERRLTPMLQTREPALPEVDRDRGRVARLVVRLLGLAWVILPAVVFLMGYVWPAPAFVLFPASIGVGVLLWLYATNLRQLEGGSGRRLGGQRPFAVVFVGVLVLVCVFWTASNYAEVLGRRLADDFAADIASLPGVAVYSESRLHLDGPGVDETELSDEGTVRYRYRGLRLLEHTGGKFFLVSDGWTTEYGVVFILHDDDQSVRLDFVRDRR
jgi:hypothetical protein